MTSTSPPPSLHDPDFYGWVEQQCAALQALRALPELSPWSLQHALDAATVCDTRGDWSDLGL